MSVILPHSTEQERKQLLLVNETIQEYGHDPLKLGRYSTGKIVFKCVICQKPHSVPYSRLLSGKGLSHPGACRTLFKQEGGRAARRNENPIYKTQRANALRAVIKQRGNGIVAKRKATTLLKYGVDHTSKVPAVRARMSVSIQQNYDQNPLTLKKRFQTNLAKYGHTNFLASKQGQVLVNAKVQARLGVNYPFQNASFQELARKRLSLCLFEKYGCSNAAQIKELLKKRLDTYHENRAKTGKDQPKEFWCNQEYGFGCKISPNQQLPDFWGKGSNIKIKLICGSCKKEWSPVWNDVIAGRTASCGCVTGTSFAEQQVYEFVKSFCVDAVNRHKIQDISVDVFVSSLQLAIEYNGLYFHKDEWRGRQDAEKAHKLRNLGIRYVGIFEDEWIQQRQRVKDYLMSVCGQRKFLYKLRPQQVRVEYQSKKTFEVEEFLDKYHYIGGRAVVSDIWAVFSGLQLIGILACGSPTRQTIREDIELKRVCLHSDYHIPGLWSYLLKNYVANHFVGKSMVSYSDNRRDTGNLYKHLGFVEAGQVRPDYYWCKEQQRFHKSRFKKNKEIKLTGMTEDEYWKSKGYYKVYDCGKTKWTLQL